jgi:hypothetical protein
MGTIPRKRRSTTLAERLTPCECCGHSISQRHHLLPVARFGEEGATASLCANCHEIYHLFEQASLDRSGHRLGSRSRKLVIAVLRTWGNGDDPRARYIYQLINWAHDQLEERAASEEPIDWFLWFFVPEEAAKEEDMIIRRGDMVRLTNGKIAQVVSIQGGYIHTTKGTYGPWQVEKVAKA